MQLAQQVPQEKLALLVLLDLKVQPVLVLQVEGVGQVLQAQRVLLDQLVLRVVQVLQDRKVLLVPQDRKVLLDKLVVLVLLDPLAQQAEQVVKVIQVLQVPQEKLALLVLQAQLDH